MDTIELLNLKVKDVMTTNVISVQENDTMQMVCDILNTSKIHHIPVTDEENIFKGIISKLDVVLLQDWATNLNLKSSKHLNDQVLGSQTAGERMTKQVAKVSPDDTIETCADIFKENLFHCLPVLEDKELVGLITTFDLLRIAYTKRPLIHT